MLHLELKNKHVPSSIRLLLAPSSLPTLQTKGEVKPIPTDPLPVQKKINPRDTYAPINTQSTTPYKFIEKTTPENTGSRLCCTLYYHLYYLCIEHVQLRAPRWTSNYRWGGGFCCFRHAIRLSSRCPYETTCPPTCDRVAWYHETSLHLEGPPPTHPRSRGTPYRHHDRRNP